MLILSITFENLDSDACFINIWDYNYGTIYLVMLENGRFFKTFFNKYCVKKSRAKLPNL